MKKITIILSTLMIMICSNGVIYAEAGEGKPIEMGMPKKEMNMQKENKDERRYDFTKKADNENNTSKETKWERSHETAHEISEENQN